MLPTKAKYDSPAILAEMIKVARGELPADLVIRGARFLDVFSGRFVSGDVAIHRGVIAGVSERYDAKATVDATGAYVVPGFIDAHVHIESSLMTPVRFQEAVLPCGTTSVIWDPHEIANVHGAAGIDWALKSSDGLDLDVFVMVPSCVPSTTPELGLETSGAALRAGDVARFRDHPRVLGLAEMMNFPGLLGGDPDVLQKLADYAGLKRDGHCPGLLGKDLNAYGVAGIHSCHESTELPEAREKLMKGVHVLVREGSCAKDADTLLPIVDAYSSAVVSFCSDDRNPADIEAEGHISCIVNKALRGGLRPEDVFRAASFAPARLYGLEDRGAVAPGYVADVVIVKPISGDMRRGVEIAGVYKRGRKVDRQALAAAARQSSARPGTGKNLKLAVPTASTFAVKAAGATVKARVIGVIPRKILTDDLTATLTVGAGNVGMDLRNDILKLAVLERHHGSGGKSVAFVRGFGLKRGAIATSINHDSHNVIVVGASEQAMADAVKRLIEIDGGIVVVDGQGGVAELQLSIGGLMTDASPADVTQSLHRLKGMTADLGCPLEEPFLQLSFLALPVIPSLKITDKGLVDVTRFALVPVV